MNKSEEHFRVHGFTMIELMVAAGILGLMVAFASVIFRFSIDAHRVASANAEIMQKLRCITEQLNDDFRGLRKDTPLLIWFEQDDTDDDPNRYDQIMFFADGDFSSVQLYRTNISDADPISVSDLNDLDEGTMTVRGNIARIQYALAQNKDNDKSPQLDGEERIFARRTHILTADSNLVKWPDFNDFDEVENDLYEHDSLSLTQWKVIDADVYRDEIIPAVFESPPLVDKERPWTFHLLMSEAVGSFSIQLAYWEEAQIRDGDYWQLRWFPSNDPDGNSDDIDSHFIDLPRNNRNGMGLFFNIEPNDVSDWYSLDEVKERILDEPSRGEYMMKVFPVALKFTFRLYDSKGVIEGGREFTHIVYLED